MAGNKKEISNIQHLLAKAFLIDGEVKRIAETEFFIKDKKVYGNLFELTDSKAGTFYIIIAK